MLGKYSLAQLGKVHPRNNADAALMAGVDDFAQAAAGQIGALRLAVQLRLVAGNDTRRIQCDDSCTVFFQLFGIGICVDVCHIDFTQVRLQHTPRIPLPPMFFFHALTSILLAWTNPACPEIFPAFPA